MLFILTGQIQSGKTRWLLQLLDEVRERGLLPFGVVAPGVWRQWSAGVPGGVWVSGGFECDEAQELARASVLHNRNQQTCAREYDEKKARCAQQPVPCGQVDENELEKLGICNVLFPQERALLFAQRRDIAMRRGIVNNASQSERAQLGWYMSNSAIEAVNSHFEHAVQIGAFEAGRECVSADSATQERLNTSFIQAFLVVDELGRMELMYDSGLTHAMQLLRHGSRAGCENALVVVREQLLDLAHEKLGNAWGEYLDIYPDEKSKNRVLGGVVGAISSK